MSQVSTSPAAAAAASFARWGAALAAGPTPERKPAPVTARQIADVMIARATASDACTEADLAAAGFTAAELARFGEAARALARRARLEG